MDTCGTLIKEKSTFTGNLLLFLHNDARVVEMWSLYLHWTWESSCIGEFLSDIANSLQWIKERIHALYQMLKYIFLKLDDKLAENALVL